MLNPAPSSAKETTMQTVTNNFESASVHWKRLLHTKKRTFRVYVRDEVYCSGTLWDGGSKSDWYFMTKGGSLTPVPGVVTSPFDGSRPPTVKIPDNQAIVCLSVFQGKPGTPSVYVKDPTGWNF
jgi:hypothetical protein